MKKWIIGFLALCFSLVLAWGQSSEVLTVIPTVDTSAYSSGDSIGGLIEIPNAGRSYPGTGVVETYLIIDKSEEGPALEFLIFDEEPTNGTYTDQAALTVHDDDLPFLVDEFEVSGTDYKTQAGAAIAEVVNRDGRFGNKLSSSLWMLIIADSSTPTFAAADSLIIQVKVRQD